MKCLARLTWFDNIFHIFYSLNTEPPTKHSSVKLLIHKVLTAALTTVNKMHHINSMQQIGKVSICNHSNRLSLGDAPHPRELINVQTDAKKGQTSAELTELWYNSEE